MIHYFMKYAVQYELQSGKACSGLMYTLDSVLCLRRLLGSRGDSPSHWIRGVLCSCRSDFDIPEAHALLFCATIYGARIFVEQEIASSTSQDAIMTLNALLRALVLSCYDEYVLGNVKFDDIVFLCNKGANPNEIAQTMVSCTADHQRTTLTWTTWELYLNDDLVKCENANHPRYKSLRQSRSTLLVMEQLIESGADLNCKLPMGCKSVQQAIEKRLEADYAQMSRDDDVVQRDRLMERIKAVLLKRGYVWVEADDKR